MVNRGNSDDVVGEQAAQLLLGGSASINDVSRPTALPGDDKNDLALVLRLSQLPSDDFDEQVARLCRTRSAFASDEARSSTPPNERDEADLEPADTPDGQVSKLNPGRESYTAIEDSRAPLPMAIPLVEVRTTSLKIGLGRLASRFERSAGLRVERRRLWIGPASRLSSNSNIRSTWYVVA
jgi:hypothetical protein